MSLGENHSLDELRRFIGCHMAQLAPVNDRCEGMLAAWKATLDYIDYLQRGYDRPPVPIGFDDVKAEVK